MTASFDAELTDEQLDRYARHLVLRGVGGPGQRRLRRASVLVVGAGGLGAPILAYLAAAGIGRLAIIDDDRVSLSNLQRQVLFESADIGAPKVTVAKRRLAALNPDVEIQAHDARLTAQSAPDFLSGHDLVIDGCDNFATRLTVSDACVGAGVPLISAALGEFEGQVMGFGPAGGPCYRCFLPAPPPEAASCERLGVLGALAGLIGALAATEALKLLVDLGEPILGRLLLVDTLNHRQRSIRIPKDPACPACGPGALKTGSDDG
ncbi:MAG: ThiF family adenylyltransferase [Rhodothalassiaceae bacterium]